MSLCIEPPSSRVPNSRGVDDVDTSRPLQQRVTVVIVTYNSAQVIADALLSLPPGVRAVVVDNASVDDTTERAAEVGAHVSVIRNATNDGFGRACNAGFLAADTPYVLFLNPDTRMEPGCLEACVAAAEADERWAIIGAVEIGHEPKGQAPIIETANVLGSLMLVRRSDHPAGPFDPNIFMYCEDDDLCLRVAAQGRKLFTVRAARYFHVRGGSTSPEFDNLLEKARLWGMSVQYIAEKYKDVDVGQQLARTLQRKMRRYRFRIVLNYFTLQWRKAAILRARCAGAAQLRAQGHEAMFDNRFRGVIGRPTVVS